MTDAEMEQFGFPKPNLLQAADLIRKRGDKCGFVYVWAMLIPGNPVFKIGKAVNVDTRIDSMTTLPYECIVLFALWSKDALTQEAYLHKHLAQYRLRGEWFRLPDAVLEDFHELAKGMNEDVPQWARPHVRALSMESWRIHKEWAIAEEHGLSLRIEELRAQLRSLIQANAA